MISSTMKHIDHNRGDIVFCFVLLLILPPHQRPHHFSLVYQAAHAVCACALPYAAHCLACLGLFHNPMSGTCSATGNQYPSTLLVAAVASWLLALHSVALPPAAASAGRCGSRLQTPTASPVAVQWSILVRRLCQKTRAVIGAWCITHAAFFAHWNWL